MHPRNVHQGRYPIKKLVASHPPLENFLVTTPASELSIEFSNSSAVKALNAALLKHYYQIDFWDIPDGYLCPPIPGRVDYVHEIADLLSESNKNTIPMGASVCGLDIGTGSNVIYPIIGKSVYGWRFVGSDIDKTSIQSAKHILKNNPEFERYIDIRLQKKSQHIFSDIVLNNEYFDFVICNPPFHSSQSEAVLGSNRKIKNLGIKESRLNFGGVNNELWCKGGELGFINRMINESRDYKFQVGWFTSLVSKKDNLFKIKGHLKKIGVKDFRVIKMFQGQKQSRFIAWTFGSK